MVVELRVGVLGAGRLGTALATALRTSGVQVDGPARRGEIPRGEVMVLCVPDAAIEAAAETVAGHARLVGHTSGARPLTAAEPARRAGAELFGLHPLQTLPLGTDAGTDAGPHANTHTRASHDFAGAGCGIAGSTATALATARSLAEALGMTPVEITDGVRPAYHAAASIASNFLLTLEDAAEQVAHGAGLTHDQSRALLAPLVRTTVRNWERVGPAAALTGPLTRADEDTVAIQRAAVADATPHLVELFDELITHTRTLAARQREVR